MRRDPPPPRGWAGRRPDDVDDLGRRAHVARDGRGRSDGDHRRGDVPPGIPPPPPPPPPTEGSHSRGTEIDPAGTERIPIHYVFPTAEAAAEGRRRTHSDGSTGVAGVDERIVADDAADVPFLEVDEDEYFSAAGGGGGERRRRRAGEDYVDGDDDEDERYGASPRRDAVTTFMSTRRGAVKVRVGSVAIGAAMGGFIGKVRICLSLDLLSSCEIIPLLA